MNKLRIPIETRNERDQSTTATTEDDNISCSSVPENHSSAIVYSSVKFNFLNIISYNK